MNVSAAQCPLGFMDSFAFRLRHLPASPSFLFPLSHVTGFPKITIKATPHQNTNGL